MKMLDVYAWLTRELSLNYASDEVQSGKKNVICPPHFGIELQKQRSVYSSSNGKACNDRTHLKLSRFVNKAATGE